MGLGPIRGGRPFEPQDDGAKLEPDTCLLEGRIVPEIGALRPRRGKSARPSGPEIKPVLLRHRIPSRAHCRFTTTCDELTPARWFSTECARSFFDFRYEDLIVVHRDMMPQAEIQT